MIELNNSNFYFGANYSDGLQHWKYIKKYKDRNGKWVYVYGNDDTHNKIESSFKTAENEKSSAEFFKDRARDTNITDPHSAASYKTRKQAQRYHEEKARMAEDMAYQTIKNNTISSIAQRTINKGKDFIERLFK